ncbi:hypothetical protein SAMN04488101_101467 [Pedobacter nyackensis]|uniref:Uncharacterized protein n=2 Tax=Pedobacter nyackensis TaxID=475255 RepID=A0A1W2AC67_9SPHI|nr:hypothetical protein SAMN04488101_101467 [Pedobacter nyackensis]
MNILKHYHITALFLLLLVLACKKNQHTRPVIPEPEPVPVKPPPAISKILVPIKLETTGLILNLKYKDKTDLLTEISDASGTKTVITYTAEQHPSELEKYKNGKLFYTAYYERADKKTTSKVIMFETKGSFYTPLGSYTLSYNNLQQLNEVKYYNHNEQLNKTRNLSYISGNLSEEANTTPPSSAEVNTYTFDQKKGIASHIKYSQILALEHEHWFLYFTSNNILNLENPKMPLENISFSYEYNEDGYPSKMTINKNTSVQHIKITYKALEP